MTSRPGAGSLAAGQMIDGKYEILGELGRGGFGTVYGAVHQQLGTSVALKVRHPGQDPGADAISDERTFREGRAAARLASPYSVRVFDVGRLDDGRPFLVMEFVAGLSLREFLRARGPLPAAQAIRFALQLSEALAEAHQLGLVHRDIKASNVMVVGQADDSTDIKLLDFGLVKSWEATGEESLTVGEAVLGSPDYMSPEQIRGERITPETDVWSLGVLLFEMLTGERPFRGPSPTSVLASIMTDPPRALPPSVPLGLAAITQRCLRKRTGDRYGSMEEFGRALRTVDLLRFGPPSQGDATVSMTLPSLRLERKHAGFWATAAVAATIAALGVVLGSRWTRTSDAEVLAPANPPKVSPLSTAGPATRPVGAAEDSTPASEQPEPRGHEVEERAPKKPRRSGEAGRPAATGVTAGSAPRDSAAQSFEPTSRPRTEPEPFLEPEF